MEELNFETITIEEVCRFCLSNLKTIDIFSAPSVDGLMYSEIAVNLSNIPISENDIYPKGLCDDCAQKLIDIQEFQLLIKNSFLELQKFLSSQERSEDESVELTVVEDELENEDYEIEYKHNPEIFQFDQYEPTFENETKKLKTSKMYDVEILSENKKFISKSALKSKKIMSKVLPPDEQDKWHKKLSGWIKKQESRSNPEEKANKIKPYVCEICGNSYTTIFSLRDHVHIHSGEMNFHCDLCGKKFGTKKNLKSHIKYRHSECEMFYCDICGFAFNRRSNLNSHKWVHSDTSRYSCEYCGKSFKWKNGFDIHVNSHLKTKIYHCYVCSKVFYTSSSQIQHCKRYHDGHGRIPLEENESIDYITSEEVIQIENENENDFLISEVIETEEDTNNDDQNVIQLVLNENEYIIN